MNEPDDLRWNPASGRVGCKGRKQPRLLSRSLKTRPEDGFHLVALGLALLLTGCSTPVRLPPIETGVIERVLPDGPVRGLWAKVRLSDPAVEIVTTAPLAPDAANPAGAEARLLTVPKWAEAEHTTLAVNANFFGGIVPLAPGEKDPGWFAGRPVDLRGLSVSDGVVVSPPRVTEGQGDPAVVFHADGHARIARVTEGTLTGIVDAVGCRPRTAIWPANGQVNQLLAFSVELFDPM